MLLADVFEKFIDIFLKYYGLDPCHYFNSAGLIWDAMLKMTKVELEKYQTLKNTCLFKKDSKEEFHTLLKDMHMQTINI